MIASTIIVLREMLEICLVIGMFSAALNNIQKKWTIICSGILSGIFLSGILTFLFYQASKFLEEDGQEYINITILLSSIICIALTILWINTHLTLLQHRLKEATIDSKTFPIIIIIALAIAREGAELVLFMHGIAIGGARAIDLTSGFLLGSLIGISLGVLMYRGLLNIPHKYFFKTINIMLILLAAGMSAQLAHYLIVIDLVQIGSNILWDSSWLIRDSSLAGKLSHGLLGYSAKPTLLQVIFYTVTLLSMLLIIRIKNKK